MRRTGKWFAQQFRFVAIRKHLGSKRVRLKVLDVGCGQASPALTMAEFDCEYHSIDLMTREDILSMHGPRVAEHYYQIDLERQGLEPLRDKVFDVVILAHIVEHLENGLEVVEQAVRLLAPGGLIYIEYPRLQSVNFPSMEGTLNFWDDPTHKSFYDLVDVASVLARGGVKVVAARTRRFWRRILMLPFGVLYLLLVHRRLRAGIFWDVFGFAEYAIGVRPAHQ